MFIRFKLVLMIVAFCRFVMLEWVWFVGGMVWLNALFCFVLNFVGLLVEVLVVDCYFDLN